DHTDAVRVRVGHVQLAVCITDAGRLVQRPPGQPAVRVPPDKRLGRAFLRVQHLDFAVVGVGDVHLAVRVGHPEGVLQPDLVTRPVHVAELEQALADDRLYLALAVHRHRPDRADLTVRNPERLAVTGKAGRLGKAGTLQGAVQDVLSSGAGVGRELILG